MTYVPPSNFEEFQTRYPRHVQGYLHRRFNLLDTDLADKVQDVYLFLLTIPEGSIHSHHPDRIAVYQETIPGCEGAFLFFVNLLVQRFMWNSLNRASRISSRSVLFSDLEGADADPDDENQPENWIDGLQCDGYDSDLGLWFESLLTIAYEFDPLVAYAGAAVAAYPNIQAAANSLGVSVGKIYHCLRVLKVITSGDLSLLRARNKPRPPYKRKKKVTA